MSEIKIIEQISQMDRDRISRYKEMLDFYQGKHWPGRERYGEKRLTFNYARVFIDKLTSYLMSGVNFKVEDLENTPETKERAEAAERTLEQIYQENGLEELDYESEIDCAILGDGCYKVTWDPDRKSVRITAPDVQGIYAWWRGDDLSQVWRIASRYAVSKDEIDLLYGIKITNHSCKITEIWTDTDFELYMDSSLISYKPNPYGFIPFIIFPNLREPKKFWGTSDLQAIEEPQKELNRAMSQISHILELSGNPIAVLENVESSSDIAVRPGAVWNLPEDAKAYLLDLLEGGGLDLHIKYIDLLYRTLHDISESPRAAFGGMDRDLSGVAMQIELYPLLQKVIRKRTIRSSVYNRRSRMVLDLLKKYKGLDFGSTRMKVAWGQVMPQDHSLTVRSEQIMVQNGIHSRRRAMDEVGVKDTEGEFKRWIEEQKIIEEVKEQKKQDKTST